ncbi:MAG: hypothetical protein K2I91_06870, partial [Muribaculaceae bacterium]|nr:hypothetical protein [Muribaculaceae bacterium]
SDVYLTEVLLWADKGWFEYFEAQLYWTLDMKAAPSRHLAHWWNDNINPKVQLYIGQDTKRTMDSADPGNHDTNELDTKVKLSRKLKNVGGNVWWHGYWVTDNYKGVADSLSLKYQSTIALPPAFGDERVRPEKVRNLKIERQNGKTFLVWDEVSDGLKQTATDQTKYVVYQFFPGEDSEDISDSQTIIALTPYTRVMISEDIAPESIEGMTFAVTALDRMNRESLPVRIKP